jgi:Intracellular proteinase inhibitor
MGPAVSLLVVRMRAIVGLVLPILGLAVGPAVPAPAASVDVRGVRVEIQLDKAAYGAGEPVGITLTLTNTGHAVASFQFSTGQMYDLVVTHEGQRVWQWSLGRAFIQAFTTLTLTPSETKTFTERWDQKDAQNQLVPSGAYEMTALFPVGGGGLVPVGSTGPKVQFSITGRSGPSGPRRTLSASSRPAIIDGAAGGEVLVNSQVVWRIRVAAGGLSASERAEVIAARLRRFFAQHFKPEALAVVPVGPDAAIVWRHQLVVTVGSDDARVARTVPLALAGEWLRTLSRALSGAQ